jgi:hypothetical protein
MRCPALPLIALLTACSVEITQQSSPIINGSFEPDRPSVVAIIDAFGSFCTGTVISRRVILTAGHCVDTNLTQIEPENYKIFFGPDVNREDGIIFDAAAVIKNPDFSVATLRNDIGIITLFQDAPVPALPFRQTPLDDSFLSQDLTFVGYGLSDPFGRLGGLKQAADIPIIDFNDTQLFYNGLVTNTCFGDSGGPALQTLANGEEMVVGVTSFGDSFCQQFGADTRVDAFTTSFIQPILDVEPPLEEGCGLDDSCNEGCETTDPDCLLVDCDEGNTCNRNCPQIDADCEDISCDQDGLCDARCADPSADLDCVCKVDGVCTAGCGDLDLDCDGGCQTSPQLPLRWFPLAMFFCLLFFWRRFNREP